MASLVKELQRDALDSSISISDLLRNALIIARKLNLKKIQQWIELEFIGYGKREDIPWYRTIRCRTGKWTPYRGRIPAKTEDGELVEILSGHSVCEIESFLKKIGKDSHIETSSRANIDLSLIGNAEDVLRRSLIVDTEQLVKLVETVRHIILNLALKMEKDGIMGDGLVFTRKEKQSASAMAYEINNFIIRMHSFKIQQDALNFIRKLSNNEIDRDNVKKFIETLRISVDEIDFIKEKKHEMTTDIEIIEKQISSPNPEKAVIIECLHSIRNILE